MRACERDQLGRCVLDQSPCTVRRRIGCVLDACAVYVGLCLIGILGVCIFGWALYLGFRSDAVSTVPELRAAKCSECHPKLRKIIVNRRPIWLD